jgi:hypothetical protein
MVEWKVDNMKRYRKVEYTIDEKTVGKEGRHLL